jgi:hypothetical protein
LVLCRHHHAQLHRGCFEIRVEEPASTTFSPQLVFVTPSGNTIESDLFPQFPPQVARGGEQALRDAAPDVTATTCATKWQGESCDYGMAVFLDAAGKACGYFQDVSNFFLSSSPPRTSTCLIMRLSETLTEGSPPTNMISADKPG